MKTRFLLLFYGLAFLFSYGQNQLSGVVTYKQSRYTEERANAGQLPFLPNISYELTFNAHAYRFTHVKNLSLDDGMDSKMPYISANGLGVQYRNLTTKEKYYQQKFGTYYVVKQPVIDDDWVITKETKKLQGYTCYKAIYYREIIDGKQKVTAWFTPQLSVPFGPSGFDGLPGLILQVQYGQHILTATKITFAKNVLEITVPRGTMVENDTEMSKILSQDTGFDVTAHLKKLKEQSKEKKDKDKE